MAGLFSEGDQKINNTFENVQVILSCYFEISNDFRFVGKNEKQGV